jgi:predicted membrane chloride channel (bestrophin family)
VGILTRLLSTYVRQNQGENTADHELLLTRALTTLTAFVYAFHYALIDWGHHGQLVIDADDLEAVVDILQRPLETERLGNSKNAPLFVMKLFCEDLIQLRKAKLVIDPELSQLYAQINSLEEVVGNCEKIKITALPKRYHYLFNILIYVFTFGIPWCLVDQIGYWSVFFTVLNFELFHILEDVSRRTETPFGRRRYDLPTLSYAAKARDAIAVYLKG